MNITEVRVKLTEAKKNRLQAFCSITIDNDFVVRDLKIIEGYKGAFVAMPSRKLADKCVKCGCKNHLRARYCNDCGTQLNEKRALGETKGKFKLYADTAHPINSKCRDEIEQKVLDAYKEEAKRAQEPGYKPPAMDEPDIDDYEVIKNKAEES
ncbi:MAG: stage V sporulation protein [Candidatus Scalindua rubra]|uniref:Stage V sporulation protein n=1 Tax=Candidatus Scalindua rubra TaxID=1872076 RepID=A0A1E3XCM0_9BACT|nr:MAG: stage V sporulation protein [Candidatus Scalindua rubra]